MEIMKFTLGSYRSNCYVVHDMNKAVIIDPGYESDEVIEYIKKHHLSVEGIYVTHGHPDHVGGARQMKNMFNATVYAPLKDSIWMGEGQFNQIGHVIPVDVFVQEPKELKLIGKIFKVYDTPGHSEGGTILYVDGVLFSGDTLFFQSIGRTDIPKSDPQVIYQSIKKIYELFKDDVIVYPGHGKPTTIGHEKKFNPFVRG